MVVDKIVKLAIESSETKGSDKDSDMIELCRMFQ